MTLTLKPHLDRVKVNQHTKYLGQIKCHLLQRLSFGHTHTHIRLTGLPGPLKQAVKITAVLGCKASKRHLHCYMYIGKMHLYTVNIESSAHRSMPAKSISSALLFSHVNKLTTFIIQYL